MMERLGIRYAPSLAETASALIVNEVTTEKYKVGIKLFRLPNFTRDLYCASK
jgi:hypothetical protein